MKTMLALFALGSALCVSPAIAQTLGYGPQTRTVHYADLDLSTAKGRATLDRRLEMAVADACGMASSSDLAAQNKVHQCQTETLARVSTERDRIIAMAVSGTDRLASRQ
ncbi:UrcA family protein [Sphingomonas sp. C3-2]|uniref:UrcA family protein n=1 Tax=Sphingomonas sp. C3-2 TaxID=3062169 RepID=UPI00294B82C6|nr:UrcA family protein [Sphingomonas sp. C3-2]WOK35837.1 UrcA family protein [Sphingomonas sp. C3-2]